MEVSHSLDFIILNIYFNIEIIKIKMKIFVCILLAATVTQAGILETKSRRQKASPRAPSKSCQDAIKVSGYVGFVVNGIYHKQEEKVSDRPLYVNKDDIAISFHELYGNWWITNKVNAGQNSGKFIV